jgi:hypothetical protein
VETLLGEIAPPNSTANRSSEIAASTIGVRITKCRPSNAFESVGRSVIRSGTRRYRIISTGAIAMISMTAATA